MCSDLTVTVSGVCNNHQLWLLCPPQPSTITHLYSHYYSYCLVYVSYKIQMLVRNCTLFDRVTWFLQLHMFWLLHCGGSHVVSLWDFDSVHFALYNEWNKILSQTLSYQSLNIHDMLSVLHLQKTSSLHHKTMNMNMTREITGRFRLVWKMPVGSKTSLHV